MGLIIKSTENKKLQYKGLDGNMVEVAEIYARLEMAFRPDGKTIEVAFPYLFVTKEAYKNNGIVLQITIECNAIGQAVEQTILTAHEVAKLKVEEQGFECVIDL